MSKKKILITTENTEHTENVENDPFTRKIIGCAIEVHRILGPGLLESTYQQCLAHELALKTIQFYLEHPIPVDYKGVHLHCGYHIDILVESADESSRKIILELKSVEDLQEIHKAQIFTFMKSSGITTDLLINFNVKRHTVMNLKDLSYSTMWFLWCKFIIKR